MTNDKQRRTGLRLTQVQPRRKGDGLRPENECRLCFFVPKITGCKLLLPHAQNQPKDLHSDHEKWRRIIANLKAQGRGLSRWESGRKKLV